MVGTVLLTIEVLCVFCTAQNGAKLRRTNPACAATSEKLRMRVAKPLLMIAHRWVLLMAFTNATSSRAVSYSSCSQ